MHDYCRVLDETIHIDSAIIRKRHVYMRYYLHQVNLRYDPMPVGKLVTRAKGQSFDNMHDPDTPCT